MTFILSFYVFNTDRILISFICLGNIGNCLQNSFRDKINNILACLNLKTCYNLNMTNQQFYNMLGYEREQMTSAIFIYLKQ